MDFGQTLKPSQSTLYTAYRCGTAYKSSLLWNFSCRKEGELRRSGFGVYRRSRASLCTIMASKPLTMMVDEFKLFHAIDRVLYSLLVNELCRDPVEAISTMALWIWLERAGFNDVILKISSLPHILINELADEAVTCLNCINDAQSLFSAEACEIPLTQGLMKKEISLQFFYENQVDAMYGIGKAVNEVCLRALTDIMEIAMKRNAATTDQSFFQSCGHLGFIGESSHARTLGHEIAREIRTMFVTFSKGYPVAEWEVRQFFSRMFGDCIESFYLQEVRSDEQALYARIVFYSSSFIDYILNGLTKAKFSINGKHVWMRKYVPKARDDSTLPPLQLPNLPAAI